MLTKTVFQLVQEAHKNYLLPFGTLGASLIALASIASCTPSIQGFEKVEVEAPKSIVAGKPFTVKVTAKTASGVVAKNVVADVKISSKDPKAAQTRGPASLFGKPVMASVSMSSSDGGQAAADVAFKTSGEQTIVVDFAPKDGQVQTLNQVVTVSPSSPAVFSVVHVPVYPAGTYSPIVYVYDAYGNLISDLAGSVSLRAYTDPGCTSPASGSSLDAYDSVAFVKGAAAFPKITYKLTDNIYLEVVGSSGAVISVPKYCGQSGSGDAALASAASAAAQVWNTVISGVVPPASPFQGGYTVVIQGSNFRTGATVQLGSLSCTITTRTNTALTCTVPDAYATYPGVESQAVDVVVTNTDGTSYTLSGGFTFYIPRTCKTIYDYGNSYGNGLYKIRPKNAIAQAGYDVQCDMSNGGWTLVGREAAGSSGSLLHLGSDVTSGNETTFANQTLDGIMGKRFEAVDAGTRLFTDVKITSGGDSTSFSLSSAAQAFFEDTRDLEIEITNFSSTNSNLSSWVTTAGGAKFCRASYTGHAAWDSSTADGSVLNLAAAPNPTYSISNAWTTIGYAQTGWGIKPIGDNYYGRYIPGTHTETSTNTTQTVNSSSIPPAAGAYNMTAAGPTQACTGGSGTATSSVPNYASSYTHWTGGSVACPGGWGYNYTTCAPNNPGYGTTGGSYTAGGACADNGAALVCFFFCPGCPACLAFLVQDGTCYMSSGYDVAMSFYTDYNWTVPDTTLTHTMYLDNGSGGTGGGGCSSGGSMGQGLFYGGITGGGFLGVSDNAQSKAATATASETLIWIH